MSKVYKWITFSIQLLSLLLVITIPLLLNNEFLTNKSYLGLYVFSKVLFGVILVVAMLSLLLLKTARGMGITISISTITCQIIPLFMRLILKNAYLKKIETNKPLIYGAVLLMITIITAIIPIIVVAATNKKMMTSDKLYNATEIPLEQENGENHE